MSQFNKKILMVMYGMGTGGAELQFLELAYYLSRKYCVKVIGLGRRGNLEEEFLKRGIDCKVYNFKSRYSAAHAIIKLATLVRVYKPSSIISTSHFANVSSYIASLLVKKTQLISLQTVSKCMARFPFMDRFALNGFDYIVAGAVDIKMYLDDHGVYKPSIKVIHNWVDFSERKATMPPEKVRKQYDFGNYFLIGCVARFHPQKGHSHLLEALKYIESDEVKLVLVGDGPEFENIKELGSQIGANGKVVYLGEKRDSEYNNLMGTFDLVVVPSVYEGLPRVLLDAMYFSKAIVATSVNGNIEALTHMESGILINPGDPKALADGINLLMKKHELRKKLGFCAHTRVKEKFSLDSQVAKIEQLIK